MVALTAGGGRLQSLVWEPQGVKIRTSPDGGKNWGKPVKLNFNLPELTYFDYHWLPVSSGERTLWVNTLTMDGRLAVVASDNQGESWKGKVHETVISEGLSDAAGGKNALVVLGKIDGLSVHGARSPDQGQTWQEWQSSFKLPSKWGDWTLEPPHHSQSGPLVVDALDRIHLYLEEVEIHKKEDKKEGALHLRFSADGEFEWSEFLPDSGHGFATDFARNQSRDNELYRVTSNEYKDQESVKEKYRYQIFMSMSRDSGNSWQKPFMLHDHPDSIHDLQMDATGDLLVCSWSVRKNRRGIDYFCSSRDGGKSWTRAQEIDLERPDWKEVLVTSDGVCVVYPNKKAKNRSDKRLYLVYAPKGTQ